MLFTFVEKPILKHSTISKARQPWETLDSFNPSFVRSLVCLFVVLWQRKGRVNYALSSYIGAMHCIVAAAAAAAAHASTTDSHCRIIYLNASALVDWYNLNECIHA